MPIKEATKADIDGLKKRLENRRAVRQMAAVVKMVNRKKTADPFAKEPENPEKSVVDLCLLMAASFFGAMLWNAADSFVGLAVFAVFAVLSVAKWKEVCENG